MVSINERIKKRIKEKYSESFLESHDYKIFAVRLSENKEIIEIKCAISVDTFVPTEWLLVNKDGDIIGNVILKNTFTGFPSSKSAAS